jgi:small-conductance mechanosensitive channel
MVNFIPIIRTIIVVIILIIVFNFILGIIKKNLLKRAKTKKQISNVEIFSKIFKYVFLLILIIFAIHSYAGSWASLGLTVGLFSAALGWALQKPITGYAAWIMLVIKRPFEIGDRIIIGNIKGDVIDITITHIYIQEIGGIVTGEENTGRIIMVPNSTLFEKNIINYTSKDEYVLDQVVVAVTYESNLDEAMEIALESAKEETKEFIDKIKKEPYIRTFFQPSGINVHVRYFAPAKRLQELSSKITYKISNRIMKTNDVEIAYPHTEVVFGKRR